jgi:hypothetical protein
VVKISQESTGLLGRARLEGELLMSLMTEAPKPSEAVGLAPERVEVDVDRTGAEGWRVSLHDPLGHPFALLGFITLIDDVYRVCAIGRPCGEIQTGTLAEAIDALRPLA